MTGILVMQGREVSGADIGLIRDLLVDHPHWGRTRLSEDLKGVKPEVGTGVVRIVRCRWHSHGRVANEAA